LNVRKLVLLLGFLAAAYLAVERLAVLQPADATGETATRSLPADPSAWQAGQLVTGSGRVTRILADDNMASRHQRFILTLESGATLLVAHNIDLAPRVDGLSVGDSVAFRGEFAPNPQGGVIHWTHHDPQGRHPGGWLEYRGRRYE
jgi:Protein of unknown function (DUF3465)